LAADAANATVNRELAKEAARKTWEHAQNQDKASHVVAIKAAQRV
jgi:hypothetical protein